jgi:hypothetical protein
MIQKENILIIKKKLKIFENNACLSRGRGARLWLSETRDCRKLGSPTYIKVVDYSLIVNVAMDGLPTRLNRSSLHNMAYGKQLIRAEMSARQQRHGKQCNGAENKRQAAASRRRSG